MIQTECTEEAMDSLLAYLCRKKTPEEQEFLAQRRVVMVEAVERLEKGERLAPAPLPRLRHANAGIPRAPRVRKIIPKTPEELQARRDKTLAAARLRTNTRRQREREEVAQGLREKAPYKSKSKRAAMGPGIWITFKTRGGVELTGKILATVQAGEMPQVPVGATLRQHTSVKPTRLSRYLMAFPAMDTMADPTLGLVSAPEAERGLVCIHDELPVLERLHTPLTKGTEVSWVALGFGREVPRTGWIEAYIPAGQSLRAMGYDGIASRADGTVDSSIRDRYLVRCQRERHDRSRVGWSLPTAFAVESAYQRARAPASQGAA